MKVIKIIQYVIKHFCQGIFLPCEEIITNIFLTGCETFFLFYLETDTDRSGWMETDAYIRKQTHTYADRRIHTQTDADRCIQIQTDADRHGQTQNRNKQTLKDTDKFTKTLPDTKTERERRDQMTVKTLNTI